MINSREENIIDILSPFGLNESLFSLSLRFMGRKTDGPTTNGRRTKTLAIDYSDQESWMRDGRFSFVFVFVVASPSLSAGEERGTSRLVEQKGALPSFPLGLSLGTVLQ